ncbi:hypothetical protein PoB_001644900, partial [Plakobranchus ocellatus]
GYDDAADDDDDDNEEEEEEEEEEEDGDDRHDNEDVCDNIDDEARHQRNKMDLWGNGEQAKHRPSYKPEHECLPTAATASGLLTRTGTTYWAIKPRRRRQNKQPVHLKDDLRLLGPSQTRTLTWMFFWMRYPLAAGQGCHDHGDKHDAEVSPASHAVNGRPGSGVHLRNKGGIYQSEN